jgi:O-acetyl-ADP-ribose deacetylase (regulator of RNase III)
MLRSPWSLALGRRSALACLARSEQNTPVPRPRGPAYRGDPVETKVGEGTIELVQGDITQQEVDAVVTAANSGLRGGGGVDGAVHRAAGPELLAACRRLGGCETGSAKLTPAFGLGRNGVKYVIHAVGPVYRGGDQNEDGLLASAYKKSLALADEAGCASIAFPSISTGVYGFPVERAAPIALRAAKTFLAGRPKNLTRVVFVLFDAATFAAFARALQGEGSPG